jgi:hypothetical protein
VGYINLHWTRQAKEGMGGRPFTKVADFISRAQWSAANPKSCKDVYFCLSLQRDHGKVFNGTVTAARSQKNAVALKAIWLDVDVKPDEPEKAYSSTDAALAALTQFVTDANLPPPTAVVLSGSGGMHVYWISRTPLTVEEWHPYAVGLDVLCKKHGFLADPGLTTDCARILRVPGTFNYKKDPPTAVKLLSLQPEDHDFEQVLGSIRAHVQTPVTATVNLLFDPKVFPKKAPHREDSLADGLRHDDTPLDPRPIIKGCPHLKSALQTGGAGLEQGLWMLDVLAATFLQNGKVVAHALSDGYANYSKEELDAMYDRKLNDRAERGLGWPSCNAFENAGSTSCAQCPHKGKIKSPLNLALPASHHALDGIIEQIKEKNIPPVQAVMALHKQRVGTEALFAALNETYAVVRYGSQVLVASIIKDEIFTMKVEDFHKTFGNVLIEHGNDYIEVSRAWFKWKGRRQYLGRGVVFEPGGPLDFPDDMLNLWRGFGLEPKQGDWSLMRNHIFAVVCSGRQRDFDYLLKWMAYAVQRPNEPIGVAVAFRGAPGAGKGVVARTFGNFFGKHFVHIANGDQLTGRFNASLATSCAVFLDEALWAGDKKGEGVLKALITEPRLQLEAKFKDPIMVDNRLRIMVASNNDWMVPVGIGDRRWFVLDVPDTYAGTTHARYFEPLYAEIKSGGAAAMFHDLLAMDLSNFDVRAVPHTAAKAQQQALGLTGTEAWLHQLLQESVIGFKPWQNNGVTIGTDEAYAAYEDFSKRQHAFRPDIKSVWSKKIRKVLGPCVRNTRQTQDNRRIRSFQFAPLADCRHQFATHIGALDMEWDPENDPAQTFVTEAGSIVPLDDREIEDDAETEPDDVEWEPVDEPDDAEWEPLEDEE